MASSTKRPLDGSNKASDSKKSKPSSNAPAINLYSGWTVPSPNYKLPSIQVTNLSPRQFYETYIQPRRPVVIQGIPSDLSQLQSWTDTEYLRQKAGDETVMIERRSNTFDGYGKGNEVSMKFSQFIQLIQNGDELHYLTTQDVQSNHDGRPDILPNFMKAFMSHNYYLPMQPSLTGGLIPQNINLWMGNTNNSNTTNKITTTANGGSSSGLHHDYHDNLYIVLSGSKRFRLFSPADTSYLYTRGSLLKVHENGRINYVNEETTAYGADVGAEAAANAARRVKRAEERLVAAERGVEEGKDGAVEELAMAEVELEEAMDDLIDAEQDNDEEADDDDGCNGTEIYDGDKRVVDKTVKNPNNFSKIPAKLLDDLSKPLTEFPDLQKATMAYCHVNAGEMLYLPASWFHEVTSYGVEGSGCHLALNYWFHPPDGKEFETPYSTDFWPNDFKDRFRNGKGDL
ncbi:hypothetical protein ACHAXN_012027 [Cyclotella atomus]